MPNNVEKMSFNYSHNFDVKKRNKKKIRIFFNHSIPLVCVEKAELSSGYVDIIKQQHGYCTPKTKEPYLP